MIPDWQIYYQQHKNKPLLEIVQDYKKLLVEFNQTLAMISQNSPPPGAGVGGPTNEPTPVPPPAVNYDLIFALSGAPTHNTIRLSSKLTREYATNNDRLYFVASTTNNPEASQRVVKKANINPSLLDTGSLVTVRLDDLQPNTDYYYWLYDFNCKSYLSASVNTEGLNYSYLGKFKTAPLANRAYRFSASYASCMDSYPTSGIFQKIGRYTPLLFIHMGDMFYWDNALEPISAANHEDAYQAVFGSGSQAAYTVYNPAWCEPNYFPQMTKVVPLDYIWDDHDYGNNNSDITNENKGHAYAAVNAIFPHYNFPCTSSTYLSASVPVETKAIYHSYNIGRVKFVVTDNRSQRTPYNETDDDTKVVWLPQQEQWFMEEMTDTNYPVKVWVNSFPWEGDDINPRWTGDDGWEKYTTYRGKIANFISAHSASIGKIIILSGDAHMTAIDDGTISPWYGTGSRVNPPITIHQSGPLDQGGSRKGGPYMLVGADIWRATSGIQYQVNNVNYNQAITAFSSSYTTANGRYGCMEVYDDLSTINIDMYSRSGNTANILPGGDQRFPSVNGVYKKLRLSLDTTQYVKGSGGRIVETRSFV
jgi:alkaline phosphatase D